MQAAETAAEKVKALLNAEVESASGIYFVKKNRTLHICNENLCFICTLELDISFKPLQNSGRAVNKAEILLLPEEVEPFTAALMDYENAFPASFRQWIVENPHIVSVNMETVEPPELFAGRLSAALQLVEPKEAQLHFTTS